MSFQQNCEITLVQNPHAAENVFLHKEPENRPLPTFAGERDRLPSPVWEGHEDAISCYWKAWELAFGNLCRPKPGSGFVSNFIDTAFNGCIFMWDSSFILMFGKYGAEASTSRGPWITFTRSSIRTALSAGRLSRRTERTGLPGLTQPPPDPILCHGANGNISKTSATWTAWQRCSRRCWPITNGCACTTPGPTVHIGPAAGAAAWTICPGSRRGIRFHIRMDI